jgi:hypothetical protein
MKAAQSIPGTTTMYVGLNGVVEIRTNGINLTNSPSRVPRNGLSAIFEMIPYTSMTKFHAKSAEVKLPTISN